MSDATAADEGATIGGGEVTAWSCSRRCWAEGGPHDDGCYVRGTYATEVVIAADGYPSIVV